MDLTVIVNRPPISFSEGEERGSLEYSFGSGGLIQGIIGMVKKRSQFKTRFVSSALKKIERDVHKGEYDEFFKRMIQEGRVPHEFPRIERGDNDVFHFDDGAYEFGLRYAPFKPRTARGFYENFANRFPWGIMHYTEKLLHNDIAGFEEPRYRESDLDHYIFANVTVADILMDILTTSNQKCTEADSMMKNILASSRDVDRDHIAWFHDYHYLRAVMATREELNETPMKSINARIGHYSHTPLPDSVNVLEEYFQLRPSNRIAFARMKLSLLGADFEGTQTPRDAANFAAACNHYRDLIPVIWESKKLVDIIQDGEGHYRIVHRDEDVGRDHTTVVGAYPMGVDPYRVLAEVTPDKPLEYANAQLDLARTIRTIKNHNRVVFGGLERYDFTKDIPGKIEIFKEYMRLFGNAQLVQITEPSRVTSPAYLNLSTIVNKSIANANETFPDLDYPPVIHLDEGLKPPQNYRFMRDVDVLMITPAEDGMNLVTFEGILSKKYKNYQDRGIIALGTCGASKVLSEFKEEDGIVRVNGLTPTEAARKINHALDNKYNIGDRLIKYVENNCRVDKWAKNNIHSIQTGEYLGFKQAA